MPDSSGHSEPTPGPNGSDPSGDDDAKDSRTRNDSASPQTKDISGLTLDEAEGSPSISSDEAITSNGSLTQFQDPTEVSEASRRSTSPRSPAEILKKLEEEFGRLATNEEGPQRPQAPKMPLKNLDLDRMRNEAASPMPGASGSNVAPIRSGDLKGRRGAMRGQSKSKDRDLGPVAGSKVAELLMQGEIDDLPPLPDTPPASAFPSLPGTPPFRRSKSKSRAGTDPLTIMMRQMTIETDDESEAAINSRSESNGTRRSGPFDLMEYKPVDDPAAAQPLEVHQPTATLKLGTAKDEGTTGKLKQDDMENVMLEKGSAATDSSHGPAPMTPAAGTGNEKKEEPPVLKLTTSGTLNTIPRCDIPVASRKRALEEDDEDEEEEEEVAPDVRCPVTDPCCSLNLRSSRRVCIPVIRIEPPAPETDGDPLEKRLEASPGHPDGLLGQLQSSDSDSGHASQ